MKKLSETQCAYIAGIVDGEGSIGITKHKERRTPRGWHYEPFIFISNTDKKLMEYIKQITGVGFYWLKRYKNFNPKWKPSYSWQLNARSEIISFLKQIYSYLIIKKKNATLLLEFLEIREKQEHKRLKDEKGRFKKGIQILYTSRQMELYNKIKELNKRGRKK